MRSNCRRIAKEQDEARLFDSYDELAKGLSESSILRKPVDPAYHFISYLKKGIHVLDAGCGSGFYAKLFLDQGFNVTAIDGSKEMCDFATRFAGCPIQHISFDDMKFENQFDAIWANNSLVHYSGKELAAIVPKFLDYLKVGGIWYMSFFHGVKRKKTPIPFYCRTEELLRKQLAQFSELEEKECWLSSGKTMIGEERGFLHYIVQKTKGREI